MAIFRQGTPVADRLSAVLLVVCLALGTLAYREWQAPAPELAAPEADAPALAEQAWEPLATPPTPPLASYEEIAARPLFREDRRPEPPPERAPRNVTQSVVRQPPLKLEGTAVTPQRRVALLRDTRSNEVTRAAAGQQLQGWEVDQVGQGWVELSNQGQRMRLEMERPGAQPQAGAAPGPVIGPGSRRIRGGGRVRNLPLGN